MDFIIPLLILVFFVEICLVGGGIRVGAELVVVVFFSGRNGFNRRGF